MLRLVQRLIPLPEALTRLSEKPASDTICSTVSSLYGDRIRKRLKCSKMTRLAFRLMASCRRALMRSIAVTHGCC